MSRRKTLMLQKLAFIAAVAAALALPADAMAAHGGGHGGGHAGGHGGGHAGGHGGGHAGGRGAHWAGGHSHGRYWHGGRWWSGYGVGPCWRSTPAGWIWICS
jgi:hypothetical protein